MRNLARYSLHSHFATYSTTHYCLPTQSFLVMPTCHSTLTCPVFSSLCYIFCRRHISQTCSVTSVPGIALPACVYVSVCVSVCLCYLCARYCFASVCLCMSLCVCMSLLPVCQVLLCQHVFMCQSVCLYVSVTCVPGIALPACVYVSVCVSVCLCYLCARYCFTSMCLCVSLCSQKLQLMQCGRNISCSEPWKYLNSGDISP